MTAEVHRVPKYDNFDICFATHAQRVRFARVVCDKFVHFLRSGNCRRKSSFRQRDDEIILHHVSKSDPGSREHRLS